MDTSGEAAALSGSEQFDELFLGEVVELFGSVSPEAMLLKSFLSFLNCGHWIIFILIFYNISI